jgi:dihydroflavonol-4-reductase
MILVTGANGFLGSGLVKKLVQEKNKVRCLVRESSDLAELEGLSYEKCLGDVTDMNSLNLAFAGVDTVFHLAGLVSYHPADRKKLELVNVQGTQNVIDACLKQKVRRLVHVSSVMAIGAGFSNSDILNEDSEFNLSNLNMGYAETKRQGELLVIKACREQGLNAVIVNPSTVYGPGDARKASRKPQLLAAQGKLSVYPNGGVSIVPIENCVQGIIAAAALGKIGERYILSGKNFTLKELFQIIADQAGQKPPRLRMPSFFIHTFGFISDLQTQMGWRGKFSRERAWAATLFHWFSSAKAQRELGFVPGDCEAAIRGSVQWMKEHGLV